MPGEGFQVLVRVARVLAERTADLGALLDALSAEAARALGDGALLRLLSADRAWLEVPSQGAERAGGGVAERLGGAGERALGSGEWQARLRIDHHPFLGEVLASRRPLLAPAGEAVALWGGPCRSLLAVPLSHDDRVLGVLYVARQGGGFADEDLVLAEQLAVIAGALLHCAQIVDEARRRTDGFERTRRLETLGRLTAGVVHDFNNMLSVMLSFGALAMTSLPPDHPALSDVREIQQAANRAAELTRQLLAFGQRGPARPQPVDVSRIFADVDRMLRRLLPEHMKVEVAQPAPRVVVVDPVHVIQDVLEAAVDARDNLPAGHGIAVTLEGDNLVVGTAAAGGAGAPTNRARIPLPTSGPRTPLTMPAARGNETILVVEDDPHVRAVEASVLRRAGYRVLEASEGQEAIAVAERHPGDIHLVVTDVVMPRMNGLELAGRLCALRPRTKVLYVSGYGDDSLPEPLPPPLFLHKPITSQELTSKVRELLDHQPPVSH
jgi:CheY-like chemotaxis protein